jgi:hypothetical protein
VAARRGGEAVRTAAAAAAPAAGEEVEERGMAAEHGGRGSWPPGRDQTGGDTRARADCGRGGDRRERRLQRDEVVEPGELLPPGRLWSAQRQRSVDEAITRGARDLCFSFCDDKFFFLIFFLCPGKNSLLTCIFVHQL